MRRGLPLLFCVLTLTGAAPAAAATPFVLPARIDYAGLRCVTGTRHVQLVVGVHYGDVRTEFETVAFLVRHFADLDATISGASGSLRVAQRERLPVGLEGRRNVDYRHTLLIGANRLAAATGSNPCRSTFRLRVRVTQTLRIPGSSGGGAQAVDLPPDEERHYEDLMEAMASNPSSTDQIRRDAVPRDQAALMFNGCLFQRSSRCPGANLVGALVSSRDTTGGPIVMGYGVSASRIDLRGAALDGASLAGVAMNSGQLQGVVGRGLQLSGSSLVGASVAGADLTGAVGSASWTTRHVLVPPFPAILQGANGSRAVFAGAALRGATMTNARFAGADFNGADLSDADLQGADLRGADFTDADLSGANLLSADTDAANFDGADLSHTTDTDGTVLPAGTRGTADEQSSAR